MKFMAIVLLKAIGTIILIGSPSQAMPASTKSYSCTDEKNAQCGATTDRYYELIAVYGKYWIRNYPVGLFEQNASVGGAFARIRSFVGGAGFDGSEKATNSSLGPNIRVKPGESLAILLRNNLQPGTPPAALGDGEDADSVIKMDYFPQLDGSNKQGAYYGMQDFGFIFEGETPASIDDIDVPNPENIPYDFNGVNIHLHGMIVQPHLFFPQGTSDSSAKFITVEPGGCYCYNFDIPEDHPTGTYWWHTHRHGSSAIWTWAQGAGLVIVEGKLTEELEEQGINTEQFLPFVVTDPHYVYAYGETNTYVVASFLGGQNGILAHPEATYLVNGNFQPTFYMKPGETKWIRFLTATAENLVNFQIIDIETDEIFPVWDIASDGINYDKPIIREQYVQGGGMRQDILLQFPSEGSYKVMSKDLGGLQFFGDGPTDQLLATFVVAGETGQSPVDISSLTFTLPLANDRRITESEITVRRTITFDIVGNVAIVPFPQFLVNGQAYANDYPMFNFTLDGHAEEWTLVSTQNATHPFHVHVLPFQVKSAVTNNINPRYNDFTNINPVDLWRDVVLLPPYGTVKVWINLTSSNYTNLNGKSVFHCHFLAHEDTGMIQAIEFIDPSKPIDDDSSAEKITTETTSGNNSLDDEESTADKSTTGAANQTPSAAASRFQYKMVQGTLWFVWSVIVAII